MPAPRCRRTVGVMTTIHTRLRGSAGFEGRRIEVAGRQVQLTERGEGPPLVLLHGTGAGAMFLSPLIERLEGVRVVAPDRPGQGLSDPTDIPRRHLRRTAVAWIDHLLDALGLTSTTLVGHSMGGLWTLWYALAHPQRVDRLVLLAPPFLPGSRCPLPYRVMATPGLFALVRRLSPPSPTSAVRFAKMMGEGDTVAGHPELVDLMVSSEQNPTAVRTNANEVRAIVSPFALVAPSGFRRWHVSWEELRRLDVTTLLIWGDREPLGGADVARGVVDAIPDAELAMVPAGHGPWLGRPDDTARLIAEFARRGH